MRKPAFVATGVSEVGTGRESEPAAELEAVRFRRSPLPTSASPLYQRGAREHPPDKGINMSMSPVTDRKGSMSTSLLRGRPPEEDELEENRRRRTQLGNDAAFWLLGLINNSAYVIMMAVAKEIAPGAVGVVFLAGVAPTTIIKVTAPYW